MVGAIVITLAFREKSLISRVDWLYQLLWVRAKTIDEIETTLVDAVIDLGLGLKNERQFCIELLGEIMANKDRYTLT
jgi:hypothetical protein